MQNSKKILAAAALGMAVGGLLGLLFALDKGAETSRKISKKRGSIFYKKRKILAIKK